MIAWNDNYLMGIKEFDDDHRQLFRIAEQILNRLRERGDDPGYRLFLVQETLTYIHNYFDRHAETEEAYMRRTGYAGYALHKALHDEFHHMQLKEYQKIVERKECSKEDIRNFIGNGVGWLLEHIATADMAIIGKGSAASAAQLSISEEALEREINFLFTAALNIEANAKVLSTNYQGEFFGKAVHQKMVYHSDSREIAVISGIERRFLLNIAEMLYGTNLEDETDLVLSTLHLFGIHFWRSIGQHFTNSSTLFSVKESSLLTPRSLSEELQNLKPVLSLLFTSDIGKFFVASNYCPQR